MPRLRHATRHAACRLRDAPRRRGVFCRHAEPGVRSLCRGATAMVPLAVCATSPRDVMSQPRMPHEGSRWRVPEAARSLIDI